MLLGNRPDPGGFGRRRAGGSSDLAGAAAMREPRPPGAAAMRRPRPHEAAVVREPQSEA